MPTLDSRVSAELVCRERGRQFDDTCFKDVHLEFKPGTSLDEPLKATSKLPPINSPFPPCDCPSKSGTIWVIENQLPLRNPRSRLFDHRFANDLRRCHDVPDLTSDLAGEYREFCQRELEWDAKRIELQNKDQELAPLQKEAHFYYKGEVEVYQRLVEL